MNLFSCLQPLDNFSNPEHLQATPDVTRCTNGADPSREKPLITCEHKIAIHAFLPDYGACAY